MLYTAAAAISILMLRIMLAVAFFPWAMPLCFEPTVPSPAATRNESGIESIRQVCPSGEDTNEKNGTAKLHEPSPGDVIIATGLGLLGGALAGAFAIRKISGTSTPYDVPLALAVLKLPLGLSRQSPGYCCSVAGSCRAFLNWIPSGRFLAYALLFGYAQKQVLSSSINAPRQSFNLSPPRMKRVNGQRSLHRVLCRQVATSHGRYQAR
jgi:hypothetical protein